MKNRKWQRLLPGAVMSVLLLLTACIPGQDTPPASPTISPEPAGHLGFGTITGTVTDSLSGLPLPGATVTCEHASWFPQSLCSGATTTSGDGSFQFENLFFHDTDHITLTAAAEGYTEQTISSSFFTFAGWNVAFALEPLATTDSPFRQMTFNQGFPTGTQVLDLWISPEGTLWAATDTGLYTDFTEQGGVFTHSYDQPLMQIIGLQEQPYTVWALGAEGATIHAYDGATWQVYGSDEGWDPLPGGVESEEPAADRDGRIWLATGNDDVRVFDPGSKRWDSLQSGYFGFTSADLDYQGHYLMDVIVTGDGEVWVADCIGAGEGFAGQGVRHLEKNIWKPFAETDGLCIFDLELDGDGRVWVGGEDAILLYDPDTDTWSSVEPPAWERFQFIVEIDFDPAGNLVVGAMQCGGASCDTINYYVQQDGNWISIFESGQYWYPGPQVVFEPGGSAWTCWNGTVQLQSGLERYQIGSLLTDSCEVAVDGNGLIWVAARDSGEAGLWQVNR